MRALACVLLAAAFAAATPPGAHAAPLDDLTAGDPVLDAKRAFAGGDARAIVLPLCQKGPGEILPGWPIDVTTAHIKAIEAGKRPLGCSDLVTDADFDRAVAYAERYNATLRSLASGGTG